MMNNILEQLYYYIKLTRTFDQKAINLQRTGRLGTYPSSLGQEGLFVAAGLAIEANDIYCPYYRDQGALIARGAKIERILCYWGGLELGNDYQHDKFDMPFSVPIASQATHATGFAYAIKYRKKNKIVLCSIGDGGTSKGEFYESLNMCAIHKLPVIFVINNNNYAISTPLKQQSATNDLSKKALAFNIESHTIDGCDSLAVYNKIRAIRNKCLQDGPILLDAKTFRLHDHTTADDASRYVDQSYLAKGQKQDPLIKLQKLINQDIVAKLDNKVQQEIDSAVSNYLAITDDNSVFKYVFNQAPDCLKQQQKIYEAYND